MTWCCDFVIPCHTRLPPGLKWSLQVVHSTSEEIERELQISGDEAWFYVNPNRIWRDAEFQRLVNGIHMWFSPYAQIRRKVQEGKHAAYIEMRLRNAQRAAGGKSGGMVV